MRFLTRSLMGLLMLALTLGFLALAGRMVIDALAIRQAGGNTGPSARERVFTANLISADAARINPVTTAFGEIRSSRILQLRAPLAGEVIELSPAFLDGAAVRAGEVLLRVDPADSEAARDRASAALADAEAETRDAARARNFALEDQAAADEQRDLREQALQRQQDLLARGVGSDAAVETAALALSAARQAALSRANAMNAALARVDNAATALTRARIDLAEAERELADTELRAAFDGLLSETSIVPGQILSPNETLGRLIDPIALEVAFQLSTTQFARLIGPDGMILPHEVGVTLDIAGTELLARGVLERTAAAVEAGQTGRLVYARLEGAGGFQPGDFVTIRIAEPALDNVVLLPATALGPRGKLLALGPGDRLEELPVTLLRRQGDQVILAAEGLAGRQIVAENTPLLGAGIRIRPAGAPVAVQNDPREANLTMIMLSPERRARLVAFVESNTQMPPDARSRILAQLAEPEVPAGVVERLERRMGG
ncbi:MAG: efflux RND transporter periplasmic adaptor subunit [Pseudorhodobacter sp.]